MAEMTASEAVKRLKPKFMPTAYGANEPSVCMVESEANNIAAIIEWQDKAIVDLQQRLHEFDEKNQTQSQVLAARDRVIDRQEAEIAEYKQLYHSEVELRVEEQELTDKLQAEIAAEQAQKDGWRNRFHEQFQRAEQAEAQAAAMREQLIIFNDWLKMREHETVGASLWIERTKAILSPTK